MFQLFDNIAEFREDGERDGKRELSAVNDLLGFFKLDDSNANSIRHASLLQLIGAVQTAKYFWVLGWGKCKIVTLYAPKKS